MQELGLLFLVLAALSASAPRSEADCRTLGRQARELAVCADAHDRDALAAAARSMPRSKSPPSPRSLHADAHASAPKPIDPADLAIAPGDGRY